MLYFLVILIPFVLMIGYLFNQTNKSRKLYNKLVIQLKEIASSQPQDTKLKDMLLDLDEVTLVSPDDIRKMDHLLHYLQDLNGIPHSHTVANSYGLPAEKLRKLNNAIYDLDNYLASPKEE